MPAPIVTSCPQCGEQLTAVDLDADTPPWLSPSCARGWWPAELTAKARLRWDTSTRSHADADGTIELVRQAERQGRHAVKGVK